MHIDLGLTALSQGEVQNIYNKNMSADEVYCYLNNGICVRTFCETLNDFYNGEDLKERLIAGLCELDKAAKRESVARKVRDWLNSKYESNDREDLIKICFALGFDEVKSQAFLTLTTDGGFHLRNPRELAFLYSLRVGKSYQEAISLIDGLRLLEKNTNSSNKLVLTKTVADSFRNVYDDKTFNEFYEENYAALGELHNTAYNRFLHFLGILVRPDAPLYTVDEEKYSLKKIVEEYLRMNVPLGRETADLTILQKTVRRFWPNTSSLTKMHNREEDVTRRILLLLYLVTDGAITEDDVYNSYPEYDDLTDLQRFDLHYWRLKAMLYDCGMSNIDPRNSFDWLILYCLKASPEEAMSERMQAVLDFIFE